jgi:hypothetical protein
MGAVRWDAIRDRLGKVAVRVDDGYSLPRHDVVHSQIEQRRALAGARLADDVNVPLAILARKARHAPARACDVSVRWLHIPGQPQVRLIEFQGTNVPKPREWSCGYQARFVELTRRACLVWRAGAVLVAAPEL